jgi:6-phosphogluconate dehydrogenase
MENQVAIPTIDAAVSMRNLSGCKIERETASRAFQRPIPALSTLRDASQRDALQEQLRDALYTAMILTYTQGMALLSAASQAHSYRINLEVVARIWRGGCIIRAALLEHIRAAYTSSPGLENLLMDPGLGDAAWKRQEALRSIVQLSAELGIPTPGMAASLAYFDGMRSAWLPANLIQAQRDYFGAHTYERVDAKGVFHTQWSHD